MDVEAIVKFVAFAGAVIAAGKILWELPGLHRGRLREEYKFAKEFLEHVASDPEMPGYLREKGYQALAGNRHLRADEVEWLISLPDPDLAVGRYLQGRPYLEHHTANRVDRLTFKPRFKRPFARRWRKLVYTCLYGVSAFGGFFPILIGAAHFGAASKMLGVFAVTAFVGGYFAWQSLHAAIRIDRAEKLIELQRVKLEEGTFDDG